jgi:hypothetical protein
VLTEALVEGMRIVGIDFRDGILFVPRCCCGQRDEGRHGRAAPLLIETGAPRLGKMVIGTVKGDIHDIGKNLVGMMMEVPASTSSTSASTIASRSIWTRSRRTSRTFSACRRCSPPPCPT